MQQAATPSIVGSTWRSLKTKIIVLVIAILVCAELAGLVWSVAVYRYDRLERLMGQDMLVADAIQLLTQAQAASTRQVTLGDILKLFSGLRSDGLIVNSPQGVIPLGQIYTRGEIEQRFDLDHPPRISTKIADALDLLFQGGGRKMMLLQKSPAQIGASVEVFATDTELRKQTIKHAVDMALMSLSVTLALGFALVIALDRLIVGPIVRISREVMAFHANPEDESADHPPSGRTDEIGGLEHAVDEMRTEVRRSLRQQTRLATLGAAISRVNHDLRNMLSTAVILSDTLERSQDPEVRRIAPRLVDSLERATRLCSDVLRFARDEKPQLHQSDFSLAGLVAEVDDATPPPRGGTARLNMTVPPSLLMHADRDQMFRALQNLVRNAYEALGGRPDAKVTIDAGRGEGQVWIDVVDNGSGVSDRTLESLFHPFRAKDKLGGSGLGLTIVREIMRAHGGEVELTQTGPAGTTFRLRLPQRQQAQQRAAVREAAE